LPVNIQQKDFLHKKAKEIKEEEGIFSQIFLLPI
jgi:hypothetical protein